MESDHKYKILLVDDRLLVLVKCARIFFGKYFEHYGHKSQSKEILFDEFIRLGKSKTFNLGKDVSLTLYYYNTLLPAEENLNNLTKLIEGEKINIFWAAHNHIGVSKERGKRLDSMSLFNNQSITNVLIDNHLVQLAFFTNNPKQSYRETDRLIEEISRQLGPTFPKEQMYLVELSPSLNLYHQIGSFEGSDQNNSNAKIYDYYAQLLGNVVFDLFLQIPEELYKLSDIQKKYNFFNPENRDFLRYFNFLRSNSINLPSGFKLGLVSFHCNIFGIEEYLIDVPYKHYYKDYDEILREGDPQIESLFLFDLNEKGKKENWIHFKYRKTIENQFEFYFSISDSLTSKSELVKKYLPLLHTAIFYEPDFYNKESYKFIHCHDWKSDKDYTEIIYLLREEEFAGYLGSAHFAVWRDINSTKKVNVEQVSIKETNENTIDSLWDKTYRLIKPKLETTIIGILQKETNKQAIQTNVSKILSRNFSHHIGSHVSNRSQISVLDEELLKITFEDYKKECQKINSGADLSNLSYKNLAEITSKPDRLAKRFARTIETRRKALYEQKHRLDIYEIRRNEFIAETEVSLKPLSFFKEIIKPFIDNTLLMRFIAASEGFENTYQQTKFKILLERNGNIVEQFSRDSLNLYADETKINQIEYRNSAGGPLDDLVAISNPHAFYSILENLIRNIVKHNRTEEPVLELIIGLNDNSENTYCVEIKDNISHYSRERLEDLQKRFEVKVLANDGKPQTENNGILEIKLSANILKGNFDFKFNEKNHPVNIIDQDERIVYQLEIPKAMMVGYIGYNLKSLIPGEKQFRSWNEFIEYYQKFGLSPRYLLVNEELHPQNDQFAFLSRTLACEISDDICTVFEYSFSLNDLEKSQKLDEIWSTNKKTNCILIYPNFTNNEAKTFEVGSARKLKINTQRPVEILSKTLHSPITFVDHHADGLASLNSKKNKINWSFTNYLLLDKRVKSFPDFKDLQNHSFLFNCFYALNYRVLIIDERLAQRSIRDLDDDKTGWKSVFELALASNVFIVNRLSIQGKLFIDAGNDLALNCADYLSIIHCSSSDYYEKMEECFECIVIHRTLFLKGIESNKNFLNQLKSLGRKVIITSGSGNLNGIKEDIFYLPFITLEDTINQRIDKIRLVNYIESAEMKFHSKES